MPKKFELPALPYGYDTLEPYIDSRTMEIHHTKHHQAYVNKLNEALDKYPELYEKPLESLLSSLETIPEDIRTAVRNHGGGHYNHSLFWKIMGPAGKVLKEPQGKLQETISATFGDFAKFHQTFTAAAAGVFGSGWAWLVLDKRQGTRDKGQETGRLIITTTLNQDSPISSGQIPLLCLDVWEHAYYLKYQNKRPAYIEAWWNVVNWQEAENIFNQASR